MPNVRLGVIGCGNMARQHMGNAVVAKDLTPIAYADVVEAAAGKFHSDFGGRYFTDNPQRLLNDDRVDAVLIATRHDSHRDLAIAAARAGKGILLEKPMALTNEDCQEIAEEVDKAGVTFLMGFKLRYCPLVQRVKNEIPSPRMSVGQMVDDTWAEDSWAHQPVTGGGNVLSQGCHTVDLLNYLHDSEPEVIFAGGGNLSHPGTPDVIDALTATIAFRNGSTSSWIQGDPQRNEFVSKFFLEVFEPGTAVCLHNRFHDGVLTRGRGYSECWSVEKDLPGEDAEGTAQELDEFISCVTAGKQPEIGAGLSDGVRATALILAAFESVRTGEPQAIVY